MHIADFSRGMLGRERDRRRRHRARHRRRASPRASAAATQVAVAFFGDGAANQGVLHESLNLAAIWKLPVLFVCENNGFAESTPAAYATSVADVASRASGYGIPGVVADGCRRARRLRRRPTAVERARAGEGPTLLEVKTLPFHGALRGRPRALPRRRRARRRSASRDAIPAAARAPRRGRSRDRSRARGDAGPRSRPPSPRPSSSPARARSPTRPTSSGSSTRSELVGEEVA